MERLLRIKRSRVPGRRLKASALPISLPSFVDGSIVRAMANLSKSFCQDKSGSPARENTPHHPEPLFKISPRSKMHGKFCILVVALTAFAFGAIGLHAQ